MGGGGKTYKEQFFKSKCVIKVFYLNSSVIIWKEYTQNMFPSCSNYWVAELRCVQKAIFSGLNINIYGEFLLSLDLNFKNNLT
jgi:hypothetical protein